MQIINDDKNCVVSDDPLTVTQLNFLYCNFEWTNQNIEYSKTKPFQGLWEFDRLKEESN